MTTIHGHEVIKTLMKSPKPLRLNEIKAAMDKQFKGQLTYETCQHSSLSLEELLGFLHMNGKLIVQNGTYQIDKDNFCHSLEDLEEEGKCP